MGVAADRRTYLGALLAIGPLLGALFAYVSYTSGPLAVFAICLLGGFFVAALYRPVVGVAVAIVLLPLGGFLSTVPDVLDIPPEVLPFAWTAIMVPICLFRMGSEPWRPPVLGLTIGAFALVNVVALVIADDVGRAAEILRFILVGILLFLLTTLAVRERRDAMWILRGLSVAAILIGGAAAYQFVSGGGSAAFVASGGDVVTRATIGFDHPNLLGGFLLVTVAPAIAGYRLDRRLRLLHAAAVLLAVAGIYASLSRGALLALLVIPFVMLRGRQILALIPVLLAIGALALPGLVRERFTSLAGSSEASSRIDFWSTAGSIFSENPVVGVGLGGFPDAYAEIRVPGKEFLPDTVLEPPPHAHNLYLNLLSEEGLLGALVFLALVVAAIRHSWHLRRNREHWLSTMGSAILAALLAFLVHNMFDVLLIDQGGTYLWVLLGLLSALVAIAHRLQHGGAHPLSG